MQAISLIKNYIIAFILFFMLPLSSFAQNHLADTMLIDFPDKDSLIKVSFPENAIEDNRNQNDSLIKIEETNKFLILPVDLYIITANPLASEINQMLGIDDLQKDKHFLLKLNEFSLEQRLGNYFPAYVLYADVGLYRLNDQDTSFVGRFGYESEYPKKIFRNKKETGYERAIEAWKTPLINDLLMIKQNPSLSDLQDEYHFSSLPFPDKTTFLYAAARFSITNRAFLAEGEMLFSHRESKPWFKRTPYSIRYRKDDKFESLELGRGGDIINRRINDYWLACRKTFLIMMMSITGISGITRPGPQF